MQGYGKDRLRLPVSSRAAMKLELQRLRIGRGAARVRLLTERPVKKHTGSG